MKSQAGRVKEVEARWEGVTRDQEQGLATQEANMFNMVSKKFTAWDNRKPLMLVFTNRSTPNSIRAMGQTKNVTTRLNRPRADSVKTKC